MKLDFLFPKKKYPCESATDDELFELFWRTTLGYDDGCMKLRKTTCRISNEQIPASVLALCILGDAEEDCNQVLAANDFKRGVYINRRGNWLLLIHPAKDQIQTMVDRCEKPLKEVRLHHTALTEVDVSSLTSLRRLSMDRNKILTTIYGLDRFSQLTELNLSWCRSLTQLPSLDNLSQLTDLDLSGCSSLTQLPPLDNLSQLTNLDLFGCSNLVELPSGIRSMKSLRRLDLRNMKLQTLPDWLPEIAEGFSLDPIGWDRGENKAIVRLHGTTVETIPDMSIFEQPYEVVAEFFRNRSQGHTRPLNEIKVVFLGDGESGKSHTIARLMNDGGDPVDYMDQSTPGIVIKDRSYTLDGREFRVHYWDFGGQEIMHSMHRIFLTGRTMYVVLLNARDDTQGDRAQYWLHNIQSFAPGAPVLLVLNKMDQNPNASVDERTLRARYSGLTRVLRMSALHFTQEEFNRTFTDALLEEIRSTGYLDAPWPNSWIQVKEQLEHMDTHYILGDKYTQICRDCQVNDVQRELLHWFNDLGVSFCFCDPEDYTLENHVILRPDWITNGLYIILFNVCTGAKNGRIPHRSIYELLRRAPNDPTVLRTLPDARYDRPGDIEYVLGIMRKFQLSLDAGNQHEFIPMLCQQNAAEDIEACEKDASLLEFRMEFDYLPNNLLHRLMVERHGELDMDHVWRTGAVFELKELGFRAVVVIDGGSLRFFIAHTNPAHRPNTYLAMLKANVDRIVKHMGLKEPTCQLIYKLDGKRDVFDYENLKLLLEVGQTQTLCTSHRRMIPIENILNQSAPVGLEDENMLLDAIRRSLRNIQAEPVYYLNGDGHGLEDKRNRRIRADLYGWGYDITDQTQRARSASGKSVGELDLLLQKNHEPWTIIEALRISRKSRSEWKEHLDRLVCSYNYFGAPYLYLLTYVDATPELFDDIWRDAQTLIKEHHPGQFSYRRGSFEIAKDVNDLQFIKTARCQYTCGGQIITVYHIFARIPTQNG